MKVIGAPGGVITLITAYMSLVTLLMALIIRRYGGRAQ